MADLSGRHALVTGAGSGIGRAIAERLSSAGASVTLVGRRRAPLDETAAALPGPSLVAAADVRDRGAVDAAFAAAAERFGALHALVANAGVGGANEDGPDDRFDLVVRTNLDGTYHCVRAFERAVAEGPEPRHAILMSSCLARFGVPGYTAYCASKAALLGMTRALALEWAERGIAVNAICPGWVDTEMARSGMQAIADATGQSFEEAKRDALAQVPQQRMGEPDEIAGLVEFLLSPDARGFTGQALDPNGGSWMG